MTYQGRCHCGAARFTLRTAPITKALRCNCSICVRKGGPMSVPYFSPEEISLEGKDALVLYQWGDKMVNLWFCGTCHIYVCHDITDKPGHYRINLGCLDDFDPHALPVELVDGKSF